MSSKAWQNCWINGALSGEVALDAAHAGDLGKPVIWSAATTRSAPRPNSSCRMW
jgi:D-aminopeptidase